MVDWFDPRSYWLGAAVALTASLGGLTLYNGYVSPSKRMPATDTVQQGFVVPSKLEITLQDLDGNGEKEVMMRYDGMDYLLTLDEQGNPRVQAFEVRPAEIVPKD